MTTGRWWRSRLANVAWTFAWMWPLAGPVVGIGEGRVHPVVWAVAGLAAFVALYLSVVLIGFDPHRTALRSWQFVLVAATGVVGVALLWTFGNVDGWPDIMLYVALTGAVTLGPRGSVAWTAASVAALLLWVGVRARPYPRAFDVVVIIIGMVLVPCLIYAMRQMQRYIALLQATRRKLAATAVSEERLRFSRDLHDLLGHTLSLIVVKAEVVRRVAEHDPAAAAREAAEIEAIGRQALAEVREAVSGYREPDVDAELDAARGALMDAGITVRLTRPDEPLPAGPGGLLGWAVREASTNAIRHSRARSCDIEIECTGTTARLTVTDDGVGGRPGDTSGTGLLGLRERFAPAGGTIETSSQPGKGFRLIATVPIAVEQVVRPVLETAA